MVSKLLSSQNLSFRHLINKINTQWKLIGKYGNPDEDSLAHPYIANQYRNNTSYGTVCLDNYNDDIKKAFVNLDFIQMSMHLMNWAQYYNTGHSNPYNNTQWLHYGIPESYSKEYSNTISNVQNTCSTRITKITISDDFIEQQTKNIVICNTIKCKLKDNCAHYIQSSDILLNITEQSDLHCQVEAIVGYIGEWLYDYSASFNERTDYLGDALMYMSPSHDTEEDFNQDFIRCCLAMIYKNSRTLNRDSIRTFYSAICRSFDYFPEEVVNLSEEEVKREMLAWATNPGRR